MKQFQVGINDNPGFDLPFADRVKLIAKVGFDAIFTGWYDGCPVDEWAKVIAENGLIYQSIHAPFGRVEGIGKVSALWEDAGEAGEAYTDLLIRCVEDAARVGVPLVIIHPYIGFEGHTPTELGLTRYARLIDAAEKVGVKLGFENVEGMEYLEAIMERFADRETAGFCWDTGHEMCYNFSEDMMAKYGKKLYGTHFNDNLGIEDPNHITWLDDLHLLPFDGIADWKGIMDRIARDGYEGILTFELTTRNKPGKNTHDQYAAWTPEQYFAEAYARAQKIIALLNQESFMNDPQWIQSPVSTGSAAVTFLKRFSVSGEVTRALLRTSSVGVYQARLNGNKVGRQVLTPGYTSYFNRVQYATTDVTEMLRADNALALTVAPGWAVGHLGYDGGKQVYADHVSAVAELELTMADGSVHYVTTGKDWDVWTSQVTFADIYYGETIDLTHEPAFLGKAKPDDGFPLIPQVGADIVEQEQLAPVELITTPKGEKVLDFGQNMTGYVSLRVRGKRGERVVLSHGEVLDKDGNFYCENYRTAKNKLTFVLDGEEDFFKPAYSFQGFRYVRIDEYPAGKIDPNAFRAIVVHSDLARTGRFACGDAKINQLYHNIVWGNKSNYLDIPTDCPQRDERLGWTGDTQVFCRTAAINYDVRKFFEKWLGDLRAEQGADGSVRGVCPEKFASPTYHTRIAAGWGDVATIVPWTLYEIYGDKNILADNFALMRNWVEYVHHAGPEEFLWLGGHHYGDWLAMDAGEDSYVGATANDLIASAFFANSVDLLIRAGEVLGKDMSEYRALYANVVKAFRAYFMENGMPKEEFPYTEMIPPGKKPVDLQRRGMTQTAITLILHFHLCLPEERSALADRLEKLIHAAGDKMTTGFLGTPYILHVLSACGKQELAYRLFFNEEAPSWLYSVNHGATTMWEHWNSVKEDGSFWSTDMNSFNHYAYGAVGDWMYGVICGVQLKRDGAGYSKIRLAPHPCERLGFAKCAIDTVRGRLESHWYYTTDRICFEFTVPEGCEAEIVLPNGWTETVSGGQYCYSVKR